MVIKSSFRLREIEEQPCARVHLREYIGDFFFSIPRCLIADVVTCFAFLASSRKHGPRREALEEASAAAEGGRELAGDSQFWAALLKVKDIFYKFAKKKIGNGRGTRFWEDIWVDDHALKNESPRLYNLCFDHNITVDEALQKGWKGFKFRRTLHGETLEL